MMGSRGLGQATPILLLLGAVALAGVARAEERDGGADAPGDGREDGSSAGPETPAAPQVPPVRITGTAVLPEEVARAAVGAPPEPGANVQAWGILATWRIVVAYRERGYISTPGLGSAT